MRNLIFRFLFHILRFFRPRPATPVDSPLVLVLQYAMPLGCCVHGETLLAALKTAKPGTRIVVATRGLGLATLLHNPHVDVLLETQDPLSSLRALFAVVADLRKQLRAQKLYPTLVLQDGSNRRGTNALLAALLRVAPTAGFADAPPLYDRHFRYDREHSLIENNLRVPKELWGKPVAHLEPAVYFTAEELAQARSLLHEANPHDLPVAAFVLQGSGGQRTGWHDERFTAAIANVAQRGYLPVYLGTAADGRIIERIDGLANHAGCSLAGRTSVPELAAVLSLCEVLVTLDTGTMHVGRAVDVPMVVLGPSWQKPLEWLPIGKSNVRILRGNDRQSVPPGYLLDEIEVAQVVAAFEDLQRSFPPTEAAREARVAQRLSTVRA